MRNGTEAGKWRRRLSASKSVLYQVAYEASAPIAATAVGIELAQYIQEGDIKK